MTSANGNVKIVFLSMYLLLFLFQFDCVETKNFLAPVSSNSGPGTLKPVLPSQPLPVSQPLMGATQQAPPINTTHPYQVLDKRT